MAKQHFTTEELTNEIWKPIQDYAGYEVSDLGRVRSWRNFGHLIHEGTPSKEPYILSDAIMHNGRHYARLRPRTLLIHRLVLAAFVGPCPEGMNALHNDDNPHNNRLSNLRYGTPKENWDDRRKNGIANFGVDTGAAKLTDDEVITIRVLYSMNFSSASLGNLFKVAGSTIVHIATGDSWPHVGGPIAKSRKGDRSHNIKLVYTWNGDISGVDDEVV